MLEMEKPSHQADIEGFRPVPTDHTLFLTASELWSFINRRDGGGEYGDVGEMERQLEATQEDVEKAIQEAEEEDSDEIIVAG